MASVAALARMRELHTELIIDAIRFTQWLNCTCGTEPPLSNDQPTHGRDSSGAKMTERVHNVGIYEYVVMFGATGTGFLGGPTV